MVSICAFEEQGIDQLLQHQVRAVKAMQDVEGPLLGKTWPQSKYRVNSMCRQLSPQMMWDMFPKRQKLNGIRSSATWRRNSAWSRRETASLISAQVHAASRVHMCCRLVLLFCCILLIMKKVFSHERWCRDGNIVFRYSDLHVAVKPSHV